MLALNTGASYDKVIHMIDSIKIWNISYQSYTFYMFSFLLL